MSRSGASLWQRGSAHDLIVHIENFVSEGGTGFEKDGDERRLPALDLEIPQVVYGRLHAFAGDAK
jgi:hypothetical protein